VRCTSTGRACEWINVEKLAVRETSIERCRILPLTDASNPERRSFDYFSSRTVRDLAWLFDSDLWEVIILQRSQSEKALRHAVVALSALQEAEETYGMPISRDRAGDINHRFAARHYNLAIQYLSEGMRVGAENSRVTTLIACLVFIHIELLRGRYEESLTHLRSGLQILEDAKAEAPEDSNPLVDDIRKAFRRLDLQSAHFGEPTPRPRLVLRESYTIARRSPVRLVFTSISQAKEMFDILMNTSFHFIASFSEKTPHERALHEQELVARQTELSDLHFIYLQALSELTKTNLMLSSKDRRGVMMLRAHLITSTIHLAVCLAPENHVLYDQHLAGFKDIVFLAQALISDFSSPATSPSAIGVARGQSVIKERMPSFLTDWGVVLPLYFTAAKCRDSPIRHAALNMLDAWRHREGFWDSALAHKVASQIVQMEEEGILGSGAVKISDDIDGALVRGEQRGYLGTATHASSGRTNKPVARENKEGNQLPGQVRVGNAFVEISDDQQNVTVKVTRKLWRGSWGDAMQPAVGQSEEKGWVTENYKLTLSE
jgi:hypothetical protein